MPNKTDAAIKKAMRKIIAANDGIFMHEVSADLGREFGPRSEHYLRKHGVAVREKDPQQVNSIVGIDRAQQSVKAILKNIQGDKGWAKSIKRATSIYNDREHSALYGEAPSSVAKNAEVQYELEAQAGKDVKHNNDKWRQKAGKLRDKGAFRVPLKRQTWDRIDAPKFGGTVHTVEGPKGANVEDDMGQSYPIRRALAVPGNSADIDVPDELMPGSSKRKDLLKHLREFSDDLKTELYNLPSGEMTLA